MIESVMMFNTGMVAVFDDKGQQMPELQGYIGEVRTQLFESVSDATKFYAQQTGGDHLTSRDYFIYLAMHFPAVAPWHEEQKESD